MTSKALIGIAAVVVVVAVVGVAFLMLDGNDDNPPASAAVIIYDGNGGTNNGQTQITSTSAVVEDVIGFTYPNSNAFIRYWNTSADGTGTTYSAGDTIPGATASSPVTLYAQWGYAINLSYSNIAASALSAYFVSETSYFQLQTSIFPYTSPVSGQAFITVYSTPQMTWTYNMDDDNFTATVDGIEYTVTLSISEGAENANCYLDQDNPTISFDITGQLSISVRLIGHRL